MSWPDTIVSAAAGLAGAGFGGWVTWRVQRRIEGNQAQLRREQAAEEQAAQRAGLARGAAFELLHLVTAVVENAYELSPHGRRPGSGAHLDTLRQDLRRGLLVWAPLLPGGARQRVDRLCVLVDEMLTARPERDEAQSTGTLQPWRRDIATRAVLDLQGYADYVRRSLLAVIDPSQPMPAEAPAPILRRADVANVWTQT